MVSSDKVHRRLLKSPQASFGSFAIKVLLSISVVFTSPHQAAAVSIHFPPRLLPLCVSRNKRTFLSSCSYTPKYGHACLYHSRDTNVVCSSEFTITCAREHRKVGERGWYKPKRTPHPLLPQMDWKKENLISTTLTDSDWFPVKLRQTGFDMKMPLSGASLLTETGCTLDMKSQLCKLTFILFFWR